MSFTVRVTDEASPVLQRLGATLTSGEIENAMGRGASTRIQRHLFGLNSTRPNQLGGKRTNFWSACARGTSYTSQPGSATVTISQLGFRQRLQGGEIRARNVKYLTIPAVAEAHGRRARSFSNLRFGFAENKYGNLMPALLKAAATRSPKGRLKGKDAKKNIGNVMYWLTPRVFQKSDPTVLPKESEIVDAALRGADLYLRGREDLR